MDPRIPSLPPSPHTQKNPKIFDRLERIPPGKDGKDPPAENPDSETRGHLQESLTELQNG